MLSSASAGVESSPVTTVLFISAAPDAETPSVKCDGRYHRVGMSWAVRRGFAALATAAVITMVTSPVLVAQTEDDAAQQAADEIVAARERANAAAESFLAAESKQALLELDRQRLKNEVAELEVEVESLRQAVETVAVDRFVGSGVDGIPILTDLRGPSAQLQANVFAQVVAETGATSIDDYDQAKERLDQKRSELNETERALERSKQQLVQLQAAAEAEVERLRAIESKRLEDESVAAAVAAQQSEKRRDSSARSSGAWRSRRAMRHRRSAWRRLTR